MSSPAHSSSNDHASDSATSRASISPVLHLTRTCAICYTDNPCERSFFKDCGHVTCSACAEQLKLDAIFANRCPACPFCRNESKIVTLVEEPGKGYVEFIRKFRNEREVALAAHLREHENSEESRPEHRQVLAIKLLNEEIDQEAYFTMFIVSIEKEAKRRGIAFPEREDCLTLANATLFDVWREEMQTLIAHLRSENEKISSEISNIPRACLACHSTTPCNRSGFSACGHVICRECALKKTENEPACDHCNKKSKLVNLYEDLIEL